MAFGLSGNQRRAQMIGGDVTVAWMDHSTGKGKYKIGLLGLRNSKISIKQHFCLPKLAY